MTDEVAEASPENCYTLCAAGNGSLNDVKPVLAAQMGSI